MTVPPYLIGAAALFWGYETDRIVIGLILSVLLEGRVFISARYDLDTDDFVKISDLTSLIFIGTVALVLLNHEPLFFLRLTAGWLPAVLLPLIMGQLYSTGNSVTIGTRLGKRQETYSHKPFDFRVYYIFICIFGAATANGDARSFFVGLVLLLGTLFYVNRGKSFGYITLCMFFSLLLGCSYLAGDMMQKAHRYAANASMRFFYNYYRDKYSDPFKTNINFGETGRLKGANGIVMRVKSVSEIPILLKSVGYERYSKGSWFSERTSYSFLLPIDEENWDVVRPPHPKGSSIQIEYSLPKGKGLLPVPQGSFRLRSTTILQLRQNRGGNLRVSDGADLLLYDVRYESGRNLASDVPSQIHLEIPSEEEYVLEAVAKNIEDVSSEKGKIQAVRAYFNSGFTYSLSLLSSGNYSTPLGNFLLNRKEGFCEYYATATVLLLRKLGIPSRYVIGYSVSEKSMWGEGYVVRKRHAHAWAEAYVNGMWRIVDTTPSQWSSMDAERASSFEPLLDFISFLRHKYKVYQIGTGEDYTLYYSIAVILLTSFLVVRIYKRMKLQKADEQSDKVDDTLFERIKTPFTPIIDLLDKREDTRNTDESFTQWAMRMCNNQHLSSDDFERLYRLHLQKRFDPNGISENELMELEIGAGKYIAALEKMLTHQDTVSDSV